MDKDLFVRNESHRDVVVLGAGFSIAVDSKFPATDQLGELAVERAQIEAARPFLGGSFESWLSYLAEPQPYLRTEVTLQNTATFSVLVTAIHQVLSEVESSVRPPAWLYRFVSTLHARRATVITFNYDRMIERALDGLGLTTFDRRDAEQVRWWGALRDVPAPPPYPPRWGGTHPETLTLCKLHGSLNWFWVPGDRSGATLNRWELDVTENEMTRFLPGREPFIVPPASIKSAFFDNPVMRETWKRAHGALLSSTDTAFIGYSIPLTDLASAGMLASALTSGSGNITIVNPAAEDVSATLATLTGRKAEQLKKVEGFVDRYVASAARELAARCKAHETARQDTRVLVGWNPKTMARVVDTSREGTDLILELRAIDGYATQPVDAPGTPVNDRRSALEFNELRRRIRPGDRLIAEFAEGHRSPIVGSDGFGTSVGTAAAWQVLIPADRLEDTGAVVHPPSGSAPTPIPAS